MGNIGAVAAITPQSADEARAAIRKIHDGWEEAADKKDGVTLANFYADDADYVSSGGPPVKGKAAIQKALAMALPMTTSTTLDSKDQQVEGDMAYDYGEFTRQFTPPQAKSQVQHGYYLVVLRRQPDGSWKIVRHVSTVPPTM
jgi:uncharacterized protein (TIGR02246 family)